MKQRTASILVFTLLLTACASTPPAGSAAKQKPQNIKEWLSQQSRPSGGAVLGAVIGGLLGGVAAAAVGMNSDQILSHAAAGAIVGAAAGYAFGKHQDRVFAGRDYAVRYAGYDPSKGYIARVESVTVEPSNPRPGQHAKLSVRYLVLGPNPKERLQVRMFRGLKYGDDYVFGAGPNEFVVPQGGGLVDSTVELTLSKKAAAGSYTLEALLEDAKGRFPQATGRSKVYVAQAQPRNGVATAR